MSLQNITLSIDDMVCISCENRIERKLTKIKGIASVKANYKNGIVIITYDNSKCNIEQITKEIKDSGYTPTKRLKQPSKKSEFFPIIIMLIIAFSLVKLSENSGNFDISSALSSKVGYGILFIIGILSSLHCVGMCGGIMLSQSISLKEKTTFQKLKPALLYNIGRLISYSILGGIVGALGRAFSLSVSMQGFISIFAGIFMVVMGLNIYGFKSLRKFSFKLPWTSCRNSSKKSIPFIVGLLNGFMPCGPLQAMQIYALSTGSFLAGSSSMFFFALGTIPLMLVFGIVSSLLNSKKTDKLLKISGIIVLVLGISMGNRGLSMLGINFAPSNIISKITHGNITASPDSISSIDGEEQHINIEVSPYGYTPKNIYVQKGIKTKLNIVGKSINSCTNEIIFPSLNIRKKLSSGDNIIEFTPEGDNITFSCWMGMKRGKIIVVDDISKIVQNSSSEDNSEYIDEPRFYNTPLSQIPTSKLIKKSRILFNKQSITLKGEVEDFSPLVIIAKEELPLTIKFKVDDTPLLNGYYEVRDSSLTKLISTVNLESGKVSLTLDKLPVGAYGLIRNNAVYAIIEVLDESNYENADKEYYRNTYFRW